MERFAKIVHRKKQLDIHSICRCCGLKYPEKFRILDVNEEFEEPLHIKIKDLLNIQVTKTDQMPPNICSLCMDKINDFYEFRLMCVNTDKQTREALGLPKEVPVLPTPVVKLVDIKDTKINPGKNSTLLVIRKNAADKRTVSQKRGREEDTSYLNDESAGKSSVESPVATPPNKKYRISCAICVTEYFEYQSDLLDHLSNKHTVPIAKYGCASCRETFNSQSQYKEHDQMHIRTKLKYSCYKCKASFPKAATFTKHMTNNSCRGSIKLPVTQEDIKCFQCKKKFITQCFFEWHGCFLKTKSSCPKCGKFYQRKQALFKHYVECEGKFNYNAIEDARLAKEKAIKAEKAERLVINNISNVEAANAKSKDTGKKKRKGKEKEKEKEPEKEIERRIENTVVKSELLLEELPRDENMDNDDEDLHYDNEGDFQNYSDRSGASTPNLPEPQVELNEKDVPNEEEPTSVSSIIKIKKEKLDVGYGDSVTEHDEDELDHEPDTEAQLGNEPFDDEVVKNIKKEKGTETRSKAIEKFQKRQQIALKLRIKQERGSSSNVAVLNPAALNKSSTLNKQKVFKIPKELAIKIKREKMDAGYGDHIENGQERDEAEADSDEDLNEPESALAEAVKIKKEKMDPGYGDAGTSKDSNKFRINPMAVLRDRNLQNQEDEADKGDEEQQQEIQIPIISGVSSIAMNDSMLGGDYNDNDNENPDNEEETAQPESPKKSPKKPLKHVPIKKEFQIENIRSICPEDQEVNFYDDFNEQGRGDDLQATGRMVQIPHEFHEPETEPEVNEEYQQENVHDESHEKPQEEPEYEALENQETNEREMTMEEEDQLLNESTQLQSSDDPSSFENIINNYLDVPANNDDDDLEKLLNDKFNEIGENNV